MNELYHFLYALNLHGLLRLRKQNALTVLSLHRISPEQDFFWQPIHPALFEKLIVYLRQHYHITTFAELDGLSASKPKKPLLILSFDDGYYDFMEYALPVLNRHQVKVNHNLVVDCLEYNAVIWTQRLNILFNYYRQNQLSPGANGLPEKAAMDDRAYLRLYFKTLHTLLTTPKEKRLAVLSAMENSVQVQPSVRMMNWDDAHEAMRYGVEVGNHTYSHDSFSSITDATVLEHEILDANKVLERKLQVKVNVLCLPNGQESVLVNELAPRHFRYILTLNDTVNKDFAPHSGSRVLDRINLIQESVAAMCLRVELFQTYLKSFLKK